MDKPLRWAIHTVKPLNSFVSGNVAILGDAVRVVFAGDNAYSPFDRIQAHAMTPHQGSGAGQAIEVFFSL